MTYEYQVRLDSESFAEVANIFPRKAETVDLGGNYLRRETGVERMISLHLPKLLLHALPGAIASAQLHLLKLFPQRVSLKFGPLRMFREKPRAGRRHL